MRARLKERVMRGVLCAAACACILAVGLIGVFLFAEGLPFFRKVNATNFLTGTTWAPDPYDADAGTYEILPMILGSLYVTAGAVALGAPIGIMAAIAVHRFCPRAAVKLIKPLIGLMAGIPSVVYGFWGITALVPLIRRIFGGNGFSILTASVLLAVMILPTVIQLSLSALSAVPESYYEGSLALGATKERSELRIVAPAAKSGILAAVVLGIGRAIGETMAVVMVAGNQARMPKGILKGVRTLTGNIVTEMGYAADLHREALVATGVVLFVFILLINLCFSALKRRERA